MNSGQLRRGLVAEWFYKKGNCILVAPWDTSA